MDDRKLPFRMSIERGKDGAVRQLRHLQDPFTDPTVPPEPPLKAAKRLVLSYLRSVGFLLGVNADHIGWLEKTIESGEASRESGIRFRWSESDRGPRPIHGGDSVVCWIRQTQFVRRAAPDPMDVWQAGVRVVVHRMPFRITSAVSTVLLDVDPDVGTDLDPARFRRNFVASLFSDLLGIPLNTLRHDDFPRVIYRVKAEDFRDELKNLPDGRPRRSASTPLIEPSARPADGQDVVVAVLEREFETLPGDVRSYRIFGDPGSYQILYSKVLAACAGPAHPTGMIFRRDPATLGCRHGPDDFSDKLDTCRHTLPLQGLTPPAAGKVPLQGEFVAIKDPFGNDGGPEEPSPFHFHYHTRTDDFAAVNAYFHCDAMFRLMRSFGFDEKEYFASGQFNLPLPILPWAAIVPGPCVDGRCINAQVRQEAKTNRIKEFRFALGDLSDVNNRLGVATDVRWVWHEFCHALLIAATWQPEFMFAHSAGDALAAVDCDPESVLADQGDLRGVTFPWVWQPLRRHDRPVEDGWGWFGELYDPDDYPGLSDPGGYRAEQILSSTLFRLYRSIGGDARQGGTPDAGRRRKAADYVLYLVMRAIAQLGDATAVPALSASVFSTALMEADVATQRFLHDASDRPGGTAHKAIRWAFEKQGLYQAPGTPYPHDGAGVPEPVDVFIDDGRGGEYGFTDDWQASPTSVWLRNAPDGTPGDEPPQAGKPSWVYVRVDNRGTQAATGTTVGLFAAAGNDLARWGSGWKTLAPAPGAVTHETVPAADWVVFGPYEWLPASGKMGLLAVASAPADQANTVSATGLACAAGPTPIEDLVPLDNNLGLRTWRLQ